MVDIVDSPFSESLTFNSLDVHILILELISESGTGLIICSDNRHTFDQFHVAEARGHAPHSLTGTIGFRDRPDRSISLASKCGTP